MNPPRARVLIVDDQDLMRAGFRMILDAQPDIEVVGEARDGAEVLAAARRTAPDVVLMDVRMPAVDGVEATRRLLDAQPGVAVVVLTMFDDDEVVRGALEAGAAGFLLKDAPPEELVYAVRVVAAGGALLAPGVTRRLLGELTRAAAPVSARGRAAGLTPREREVLQLIGLGLSNGEIAGRLVVAERTVKTHVGRILAKLGARDRAQAVIAAYDAGLVRPRGDGQA